MGKVDDVIKIEIKVDIFVLLQLNEWALKLIHILFINYKSG